MANDETLLDLTAVKPPVMRVAFPDGQTREYDIFQTLEKLGSSGTVGKDATGEDFDMIRRAFSLPTAAEAAAAHATPLHPRMCMMLANALMERVEGDAEIKKAYARLQKLQKS